jgi:hypothetical protein
MNRMSALAATIAIAAACGKNDGSQLLGTPDGACSATESYAVRIAVRDSISGRALADSASGHFTVDATTDTLFHWDSLTLAGGLMVGSYDVTVQRPGYKTWTKLGISATKTTPPCGSVESVNVTAALQKLP